MRLWSQMKFLQRLLIVLIVFLIVPVLVVSAGLFSSAFPLAQREMRDMLVKTVDQLHENINYRVTGYQNMIMQMAVDPRIAAALTHPYTDLQEEVLALQQINGTISRVRSYFPIKTIQFYKTNASLHADGGSIIDLERAEAYPWVQAMDDAIQPFYWYFSLQSQQPTFHISKRLIDYSINESYGILDYEITTQALFDQLGNPIDLDNSWIVLADEQGRALIDYSDLRTGDSIRSLGYLDETFSSGSGYYDAMIDGQKHLVVYQTTTLGWKVISIVSQEVLWQQLQSVRYAAIAASGLFVLLTLVVLFSFGKRITNRINRLVRSMRKVREGAFGLTVKVNGKDELGDVEDAFNEMSLRLEASMSEIAAARIAAEAEKLRLLQAQINPHFLYNTLALVKSLAMDVKAPEISEVVDALARFFRLALNQGQDVLTLRQELEHVRAYLYIHELRYPGWVACLWEIDEQALDCSMVKLTMQPLIENCLQHAFVHQGGRGTLRIRAVAEEGGLVLSIADDGIGMTEERARELMHASTAPVSGQGGFGIANVHERLQRHYGHELHFKIASQLEVGTTIMIRIPQHDDASKEAKP